MDGLHLPSASSRTWGVFEDTLCNPLRDDADLSKAMGRFNHKNRSPAGLLAAARALERDIPNFNFYGDVLPAVQRYALQLPDLFAEQRHVLPLCRSGDEAPVSLTRQQVRSLLACSVFQGLGAAPERHRFGVLDWGRLLSSSAAGVAVERLKCLLYYFHCEAAAEAAAAADDAAAAAATAAAAAAAAAAAGAEAKCAAVAAGNGGAAAAPAAAAAKTPADAASAGAAPAAAKSENSSSPEDRQPQQQQQQQEMEQETIQFRRRVLAAAARPRWAESAVRVSADVRLSSAARIEDFGDADAVVDFANRQLHLGIVKASATQEEVLFSTRPELFAALLVCETMEENEAVVISGARAYCDYTGYRASFRFRAPPADADADAAQQQQQPQDPQAGTPAEQPQQQQQQHGEPQEQPAPQGSAAAADAAPQRQPQRQRRAQHILAMDAFVADSAGAQFSRAAVERDLDKAYVGFAALRDRRCAAAAAAAVVATGLWGCGVFGGDPVLKFLQQALAASQARVALRFSTFRDPRLEDELRALLLVMLSNCATVADVYAAILSYPDARAKRARHGAAGDAAAAAPALGLAAHVMQQLGGSGSGDGGGGSGSGGSGDGGSG